MILVEFGSKKIGLEIGFQKNLQREKYKTECCITLAQSGARYLSKREYLANMTNYYATSC